MGERVPAYWCVRDWLSPLGWQIYELYMLILVLILPTVIMAVAYCAIGREIWRVTAQRSAMIKSAIDLSLATFPPPPTYKKELHKNCSLF